MSVSTLLFLLFSYLYLPLTTVTSKNTAEVLAWLWEGSPLALSSWEWLLMKITTSRFPYLAQAFLNSSSWWLSDSQCSAIRFTYWLWTPLFLERALLLVCKKVQSRESPALLSPRPFWGWRYLFLPEDSFLVSPRSFFPTLGHIWMLLDWSKHDWTFPCPSPRPSLPLKAGTLLFCCRPKDKANRCGHGIFHTMHPSFSFFPVASLPLAWLCYSLLWKVLSLSLAVTVSQLMLSMGSFSPFQRL